MNRDRERERERVPPTNPPRRGGEHPTGQHPPRNDRQTGQTGQNRQNARDTGRDTSRGRGRGTNRTGARGPTLPAGTPRDVGTGPGHPPPVIIHRYGRENIQVISNYYPREQPGNNSRRENERHGSRHRR